MIRRIFIVLVLVIAVAFVGLFGLKAWSDAHYFDGYDPALPLEAEHGETRVVDGMQKVFDVQSPARYRVTKVSFEARPDERVPTLLTFPVTFEGRLPVVVLLHGSHQEKEFVEEICTPFNEAGFAMVCFDQYMRGERKVEGGAVAMIGAYRERMWKTVHDTRRLIDYLETREDIDPRRIYLCGASYGAITGTTVLAHEPRIRAAVLVVGGGNFPLMSESPVIQRELPGWAAPLVKGVLKLFFDAGDPIHSAPKVQGRPVLMQNGLNDTVVIPEAGKALYAALGEPKEIRWYPIDHPDIEPDGTKVIHMLEEGLAWLVEQDAEFREQPPQEDKDANSEPAANETVG